MKTSDWQLLFSLLCDGAALRVGHGDESAVDQPRSLIIPLRETLSPEEFSKLIAGMEQERLDCDERRLTVTAAETTALLAAG